MNVSSQPAGTSILVLGASNTGKTHYIIQLFGRLRSGAGALKLRTTPDSFAPLEASLTRLNQGLPAIHTATTAYHELRLLMVAPDRIPLDLLLPDYGGEQIRAMMDGRRISPEWENRVLTASGLLLFLRLGILREERNIVNRPVEKMLESHPQEQIYTPSQWSDQARIIEFLQLLLYARSANLSQRLATPVIGIILSCWDEIGVTDDKQTPEQVLRAKLPLLADFVEANWQKEARFVFGLSSLERPLDDKLADDEFINKGPEHFGYVIAQNGEQIDDLTLPLAEVLKRHK